VRRKATVPQKRSSKMKCTVRSRGGWEAGGHVCEGGGHGGRSRESGTTAAVCRLVFFLTWRLGNAKRLG
jgi:hypothetical protein